MLAKLESSGPRSADGPLRTAVAKAIMLPCGDKRGIDCWSLVASGGENFDKRCRDFAFGKIAESPKFSGEEGLSLQTAICLIERSELWIVAFCGFRRKT